MSADQCEHQGCYFNATLHGPTGSWCREHRPRRCVRCQQIKPDSQLTPCGPRHYGCHDCWEQIYADIRRPRT